VAYRENSNWNEHNEIRCLLIFKKLLEAKFPRKMQNDLCREMAEVCHLDSGSISAKVSNYKSVAGIIKPSNASTNTKEIYQKYGALSAQDIENLLYHFM
jgi:hypothetical protein